MIFWRMDPFLHGDPVFQEVEASFQGAEAEGGDVSVLEHGGGQVFLHALLQEEEELPVDLLPPFRHVVFHGFLPGVLVEERLDFRGQVRPPDELTAYLEAVGGQVHETPLEGGGNLTGAQEGDIDRLPLLDELVFPGGLFPQGGDFVLQSAALLQFLSADLQDLVIDFVRLLPGLLEAKGPVDFVGDVVVFPEIPHLVHGFPGLAHLPDPFRRNLGSLICWLSS